MSEPIIDPWIFYWIDIIDRLRTFSVLSGFALLVIFSFSVLGSIDPIDEKTGKTLRLFSKVTASLMLVFTILALFLPTADIMYKMLAASFITPENINASVEITKEGIEYIMNTIVDTAKRLSEVK